MTPILILIILGLVSLLLMKIGESQRDKKKIEHFYNMTRTLAKKNLQYEEHISKIQTITLHKQVGSLAMAIKKPEEIKDRIMEEVKNYLIDHLMEQPGLIHITEEREDGGFKYTIKVQFVDQSKKESL